MVETWKTMVGEDYLGRYGLTYDQVLTETAADLMLPDETVQQGNSLGELAADAFLWAAEHLAGRPAGGTRCQRHRGRRSACTALRRRDHGGGGF